MARIENCPTCRHKVSENASACLSCGEPLGEGWIDQVRAGTYKRPAGKKSKKAGRRSRISVMLLFSGVIVGVVLYDNWGIYLKKLDPERWQAEVTALEEEVAKVPASDHEENIRLYQALVNHDPKNLAYLQKLGHYKDQKWEKENAAKIAERKAVVAREAAVEAERRRKGFHCLSQWDGSHRGVKRYVEERLKDPDSFEHIETRITPVDAAGEHKLSMEYRAKNGFGGMTVGVALATISNAGCRATILSVE